MYCSNKIINDLPSISGETFEFLYINGFKQSQVSKILSTCLENVKVRLKRAKDALKMRFSERYKTNLIK